MSRSCCHDRPVISEVRIVVADDHPVVSSGLRTAIEADRRLVVVAEARDGEAALQSILDLKPNVAVLDLDMPKMSGLDVAREIQRLRLDVSVMILTIHDEEDLLQMALEVGAKGYLLKHQALTEIVRGILMIGEGKYYVSSALSDGLLKRRMAAQTFERSVVGFDRLTDAERQILVMVAGNKSSKEIAVELGIHYRTVENHRNNICRKLSLQGANALLRFAMANRNLLR